MVQGGGGKQAVNTGNGPARIGKQPTPAIGHLRPDGQDARTELLAQVVLQPQPQFFAAGSIGKPLHPFANFAERQDTQV